MSLSNLVVPGIELINTANDPTVRPFSPVQNNNERLIQRMMGRTINANDLYAFVHIEKTAGTTLINLMKRTFGFDFMEVRPLVNPAASMKERHFSMDDLRHSLKFNRSIKCISGHSIYPSRLGTGSEAQHIHYITLFRDPVRRYLSHYNYICRRKNRAFPFEKFLTLDRHRNLQTRKIAHTHVLEDAIETIEKDFMLVGLVEEFDEFLLMLGKKLFGDLKNTSERLEAFHHKPANVSGNMEKREQLLDKYYDEIIANNQDDIALYNYTKENIIPAQREWYGLELEADLSAFSKLNEGRDDQKMSFVHETVRRVYYDGISGIIRKLNGLPAKGSY